MQVLSFSLYSETTADTRNNLAKIRAGFLVTLDESRWAKEDAFYRLPRTEGEREWFLQNRPKEATHWNLLADLRPEHLQYGD
jgi:hypothetical protein